MTSDGIGRGTSFTIDMPIVSASNQETLPVSRRNSLMLSQSIFMRHILNRFLFKKSRVKRDLSSGNELTCIDAVKVAPESRLNENPVADAGVRTTTQFCSLPSSGMNLSMIRGISLFDEELPRSYRQCSRSRKGSSKELFSNKPPVETPVTPFQTDAKSSLVVTLSRKSGPTNQIQTTGDHILIRNRVLIVDDAPLNRKMMRRILESRFDNLAEAENGQQALDMVRASLEQGEDARYDVITMDYQMPVMDGVTATRHIRQLGYTGQIIGVTGNALAEDVNTFLSSGADVVLTKPLTIAAFDEYLNSYKSR